MSLMLCVLCLTLPSYTIAPSHSHGHFAHEHAPPLCVCTGSGSVQKVRASGNGEARSKVDVLSTAAEEACREFDGPDGSRRKRKKLRTKALIERGAVGWDSEATGLAPVALVILDIWEDQGDVHRACGTWLFVETLEAEPRKIWREKSKFFNFDSELPGIYQGRRPALQATGKWEETVEVVRRALLRRNLMSPHVLMSSLWHGRLRMSADEPCPVTDDAAAAWIRSRLQPRDDGDGRVGGTDRSVTPESMIGALFADSEQLGGSSSESAAAVGVPCPAIGVPVRMRSGVSCSTNPSPVYSSVASRPAAAMEPSRVSQPLAPLVEPSPCTTLTSVSGEVTTTTALPSGSSSRPAFPRESEPLVLSVAPLCGQPPPPRMSGDAQIHTDVKLDTTPDARTEPPLPAGWEYIDDPSAGAYYLNTNTGKVSWDLPTGNAAAAAAAVSAADVRPPRASAFSPDDGTARKYSKVIGSSVLRPPPSVSAPQAGYTVRFGPPSPRPAQYNTGASSLHPGGGKSAMDPGTEEESILRG